MEIYKLIIDLLNLSAIIAIIAVIFYAGALHESQSNPVSYPEYIGVNESYHTEMIWFEGTQGGEPDKGMSEVEFVDYIDNGTGKRLNADNNNTIIPIQVNSTRSDLVHVGRSTDNKNIWIVYL